ncbi:molecular chaperone GrpE [Sporosarcina sp. HYO08]|nr:molecular chaperone GrpE [Sporosarcina sp. HYO08]
MKEDKEKWEETNPVESPDLAEEPNADDAVADNTNLATETELAEAVEAEQSPVEDPLTELTEKLKEEEDRRYRLLADFENFKRRANLDKEALQKYRAQSLLTNLIPVLDNFSRALAVETQTEEAQSIMTGMDMIYRNLLDALKEEGLTEIEAMEQEFDPNFHQAVMTGNEEDKPSGIVLEELQKGYILKDRVLRPSMVKVNE